MNAQELRIGNYVNLMLNHEDYETLTITTKDLEYIEKNQGHYEPVLLTDDWLYKFGFEHIDKGDNAYITYADQNHDYYLQLDVRKKDNKYSILNNTIDELVAFSMTYIMYVHQLQNLYFALKGQELTTEKI